MHWPIVDSQTHDTKLERPGAYTPKDGIGIAHLESGTLGFVSFAFQCFELRICQHMCGQERSATITTDDEF